MTKPNGKLCRRCKVRPSKAGTSSLCESCSGRCKVCGEEAGRAPAGNYRTHCAKCRSKAERTVNCGKCGAVRDGSHSTYCRACYRAYSAEWVKKNPEKAALKSRRRTLMANFGLTIPEWDAMFVAQEGRCAVCRTDKVSGLGNFAVDHCHVTGKVRALLCGRCNTAMGMVGDDSARLRALADYLDLHAVAMTTSAA